ncbi:MAG TPA: iron chelate uptake ABC transporter family permease subunit [Arachnia sp.]|nr:iron chelate uptake ABC transporter family permease subunit [Arachnia sp.]HMT85574.1 iron chelate uptake ABC transporter family permease subunit [Arachnia sp.]
MLDAGRRVATASTGRRILGLLAAIALLALVVVLSIVFGAKNIAVSDVIDALAENTGQDDAYVIWELRLPRTVAGLLVGAALGVAGALIQALTRNPLADPGILGVNAGAAFFVAVGTAFFGVSSIGGYVWFAFAGALVVTVAVYAIGSGGRGSVDPVPLTLAGVALGAVLGGLVTGIVLLNLGSFEQMRAWSAGSVVGRGWDVLTPMLPFLSVGMLLAAFATPALNTIALGDDLARALGTRIVRTRIVVIVAVTLLAGGATAIAGPIGFVGLMVPHIARWIVGPDQRWILAYTVVLGPVLMLTSDIAGRLVMRPGEIPVGIVTAFIGAPVLIVLVRRRRASGL